MTEDYHISGVRKEDNGIELFLESSHIYHVCNCSIDYDMKSSESDFEITINGVREPPIGLTALGTAKARIPLGDLEDGEYVVRLLFGYEEKKYLLKVGEELGVEEF